MSCLPCCGQRTGTRRAEETATSSIRVPTRAATKKSKQNPDKELLENLEFKLLNRVYSTSSELISVCITPRTKF
uniref:Uncharacterized protein n=1 Tax=Solanum tuberosum TaxID=4113 RepID=M0ZN65_SOLTU